MRRRAARVVLDRPGRLEEDLLLHEPDACSASDGDIPRIRRFETGCDAKQGGLPHSIRPDETHPVAVRESERRLAEDEPFAEPLRDSLDRKNAHVDMMRWSGR